MIRSLFLGLLISLAASAGFSADLEHIFASGSPTSTTSQTAVHGWFTANCQNMSWVLSVSEIPAKHQACGDAVEQVHVAVALSHLTSEFIFWVHSAKDNTASVDWIHEEWISWHLCSYPESFEREDLTCKAQPVDR